MLLLKPLPFLLLISQLMITSLNNIVEPKAFGGSPILHSSNPKRCFILRTSIVGEEKMVVLPLSMVCHNDRIKEYSTFKDFLRYAHIPQWIFFSTSSSIFLSLVRRFSFFQLILTRPWSVVFMWRFSKRRFFSFLFYAVVCCSLKTVK